MYLKLIHHEYKYAVEQIMLILFPGQRPDYFPALPGRIRRCPPCQYRKPGPPPGPSCTGRAAAPWGFPGCGRTGSLTS